MKIAILLSGTTSSWKSCQSITQNILECYNYLSNEYNIKSFDYNSDLSKYDIHNLSKKIIDFLPDKIVFIDHRPNCKSLIEYLHLNMQSKKPDFIFHIYGDFSLFSVDWWDMSKTLVNYKTKFICASLNQKRLVEQFIKEKSNQVIQIPFPIDEKVFFFDKQIRENIRKKLKIENNDQIFLYTGRLSQQKNIISMLDDFDTYLDRTSANSFFFFSGPIDDIGIPFVGHISQMNEYLDKLLRFISKLPERTVKRIRYLGNLNQQELKEIYIASDCYVSLSIHNDEDYGMSPAEALCTGLPVILTKWGGFPSFFSNDFSEHCTLIPTKLHQTQITYERNLLVKHLFRAEIQKMSLEKRIEWSLFNQKQYGKKNVQLKIKNLLEEKFDFFPGFNSKFENLAFSFRSRKKAPFLKSIRGYTELYMDIYDCYTK